jgi:hypothetical protein
MLIQLRHNKKEKDKNSPKRSILPSKWLAPGLFDKITGEIHKKTGIWYPTSKIPCPCIWQLPGLKLVWEEWKIVGITPADAGVVHPWNSWWTKCTPCIWFGYLRTACCYTLVLVGWQYKAWNPIYCNIYSMFKQRMIWWCRDIAIHRPLLYFLWMVRGLVGEYGPISSKFVLWYCLYALCPTW